MPGTEILFCLLGGKRRVGGAGLLAVDGLELCKGTAHLSGDVHMGDEALALRAVAVGVVGQAGDLAHEQVDVAVHSPHAADVLRKRQRTALRHDLGAVGRVVDDDRVGRIFAQHGLHAVLHRGVLAQDHAVPVNAVLAQQVEQQRDIIAAVCGLRFQQVGMQTVGGLQVACKDFRLGQTVGPDGRVERVDLLAQRLGGVARPADDDVMLSSTGLHGLGEGVPARQHTAAEQHHDVRLGETVFFLQSGPGQRGYIPLAAERAEGIDGGGKLVQIHRKPPDDKRLSKKCLAGAGMARPCILYRARQAFF